MTTYSWIAAVNGAWTTASRWTPNGGPQQVTTFPGNSGDDAVFATGGKAHYTVTVGGESASLRVSRDHVTFDHFNNNDSGYGGSLLVNAGADLTVTSTSSLDYFSHDGYGGGSIDVNHARLTDHGFLSGYGGTIGAGGVLTLAGSTAALVTLAGMNIAAGGLMTVSGGASYVDYTPPDPNGLAGILKVTGQGSSASLPGIGGTGTVEVSDHATINVYTTATGSLSFLVGDYARLEFDGSVAPGARIDFAGQHGTVALKSDPDHAGQGYAMGGVIRGFSHTDALLLDGTPVTRVHYTAGAGGVGSLKLFDGNTAVGTLAVAGNYAGHHFAVTRVSATESRITEQPVTPWARLTEALPDVIAELKAGHMPLDSILAGLAGTLPPALDRSIWQVVASSERHLTMPAYSVFHPSGNDALPMPPPHH